MFFPKAAFVFSFLALSNIAAASTPACLLSAVGSTLSNPADLKDACVTNTDKLQKKISDSCDESDLKDALNWYSETCSQAGHKVDVSVSSSSSSSPTGTSSSGSSKSTGFTTATATSGTQSGSGSSSSANSEATPSASGTPENNAGSSDRHVSAAAFAAVVFVGFAATL